MKKKFISLALMIGMTLCIAACGKQGNDLPPTSTTQTTEIVKNADLSTDEIDKDDSLTVEEKYAKAVAQINLDEYLETPYENITPVTPEQVYEMMEKGETFVLFHGRSDCRYCKYVYPASVEYIPDGYTMYYLNTDYFRYLYPTAKGGAEEDESEFFKYVKSKHDEYKEIMDFAGVPNIRYIKNGKVEYKISNPLSSDFFSDTATQEEKEGYLQAMRDVLAYYMDYIYSDMQGYEKNGQTVTIIK